MLKGYIYFNITFLETKYIRINNHYHCFKYTGNLFSFSFYREKILEKLGLFLEILMITATSQGGHTDDDSMTFHPQEKPVKSFSAQRSDSK